MTNTDDRSEPVTRLGADSGGRTPGEGGGPTGPFGTGGPGGPGFETFRWGWGPDEPRRRGLPWIGIFLLVLGGLLLVQRIFPEYRVGGSVVALAIGVAFLVQWAVSRGTASLYLGSIVTALSIPGLVNAAGITANGLTTVSLGAAFLFIALVRAATGRGVGWQAWLGTLLVLLGVANMADPSIGGLLVPIGLIALGGYVMLRTANLRRR